MDHFTELDWVIENISYWNQEVHGRLIMSPRFTSSLWFVLYPRGTDGQEEHVEIEIVSHKNAPPSGELSFLCSDGSLIHSHMVENPDEYYSIGPPLVEVLDLIKEKEEDRLTLRYRFKSEEENKQIFRTVIDFSETTLEIDPGALECVEICFTHYQSRETHYVHLNSVEKENDTELQIEWPHTDNGLVQTSVNFLTSVDVIEKNKHVFRGKERWAFFSFNDRELFENGTTVLLHLKIINGKILQDPIPSLCTKGVRIALKQSPCIPEKKPPESPIVIIDHTDDFLTALTKDFMCLFQDQDFSDFQLKCGGVSVPVHKNILSARSPVFKRLLTSDMREAASDSVDIEDLDAPTLARFLAFLYTGAVGEDLDADSALKLYYAADKYEVSTLKEECAEFLCGNVCLSNVCQILSLADKHGDDHLTKVSRSFILENFNEVLRTEEWKRFMESESILAVKTLTHFAEKNDVSFKPLE